MRNLENITESVSTFGGLDRETDEQLLPLGKFRDGYNMVSDENGTAIRVRNGIRPVINRIFTEPFKIMGGAKGRLFTPPTIKPVFEMLVDEDYALRLSYSPNSGLYVNSDHPTQSVTFSVYGGSEIGVTGNYSWNFGDGSTTSGSATSVSHNYTTSGIKTVTVSAVGDDGNTYTATTTLNIEKRPTAGISVPSTGLPDPVTPPSSNPTGSDSSGSDNDYAELFLDLKVNGSEGPVNLSSAGDVELSWTSENAAEVYVDGNRANPTGTNTLTVSGSRWVEAYAYSAAGEEIYDAVEIRVNDEEGEPSMEVIERYVLIEGPENVFSGDTVNLSYTFMGILTSGGVAEPVVTTADLACFHDEKGKMTSGDAGSIYNEVLSFTAESSKSNSDTILPVLKDGINNASMAIWAIAPEYPDVIGVKVLNVSRKRNDFDIEILDASTDPLVIDDPLSEGENIYILITAKVTGSSTIDTNFQGSVRVLPSVTDNLMNPDAVVRYNGAFATEDYSGVSYLMDGNVIPENVWREGDAGKCVVSLNVKLQTTSGGFPAYPAWQELDFNVEQI